MPARDFRLAGRFLLKALLLNQGPIDVPVSGAKLPMLVWPDYQECIQFQPAKAANLPRRATLP